MAAQYARHKRGAPQGTQAPQAISAPDASSAVYAKRARLDQTKENQVREDIHVALTQFLLTHRAPTPWKEQRCAHPTVNVDAHVQAHAIQEAMIQYSDLYKSFFASWKEWSDLVFTQPHVAVCVGLAREWSLAAKRNESEAFATWTAFLPRLLEVGPTAGTHRCKKCLECHLHPHSVCWCNPRVEIAPVDDANPPHHVSLNLQGPVSRWLLHVPRTKSGQLVELTHFQKSLRFFGTQDRATLLHLQTCWENTPSDPSSYEQIASYPNLKSWQQLFVKTGYGGGGRRSILLGNQYWTEISLGMEKRHWTWILRQYSCNYHKFAITLQRAYRRHRFHRTVAHLQAHTSLCYDVSESLVCKYLDCHRSGERPDHTLVPVQASEQMSDAQGPTEVAVPTSAHSS